MKKAFTLIELLVVIAIIAILAAILFPVFAQAKQAAKKTASLSNVKQHATAIIMYGGDSDDVFPDQSRDPVTDFPWWTAGSENPCANVNGTGDDNDTNGGCKLGFMSPQAHQNWGQEIYPYVKSLDMYKSSAAKNTAGVPWSYSNASGAGNASYDYNGAVLAKSQTSISAPADLITLQGKIDTGREALVQPTQFSPNFNGGGRACNGIDLNWMGNTYDKGDAYAFADGHAKYLKRPAVKFRNFGISSDVHFYQRMGDVPNTTGLTDTPKNDNFWETWGTCDLSAL
ncbi:hypothetical protein BH11ARM2_BH11ARM2_16050 [soil metagenome]